MQGFSKQRRGAHLSPSHRNSLVLEFAHVVNETHARALYFKCRDFPAGGGAEVSSTVNEMNPVGGISDIHVFCLLFRFWACSEEGQILDDWRQQDAEPLILPELELSAGGRDCAGRPLTLPGHPLITGRTPQYPKSHQVQDYETEIRGSKISHVPQGGGCARAHGHGNWFPMPPYNGCEERLMA